MDKSLIKWLSVELFFTLNILVVFSYAILSHDLSQALQLSESQVGTLGGVFFFAYASALLVLGTLFGSVSTRWLMFLSAAISSMGTMMLGLSENLVTAVIARILMGIGFSTAFVGTVHVINREYPEKFALMTAVSQSFSNFMGALIGLISALFPILSEFRAPFKIYAALLALNALLMLLVLDGDNGRKTASKVDKIRTSPRDFFGIALIALRSPQMWICAVYFSGIFGTFLAYADIWDIVFQIRTFEHSGATAAMINSSLPIGLTLGGLVSGWWAERSGFVTPTRVFSIAAWLLLAGMSLHPLSIETAGFLMFWIGFALSASAISLATLPLHLPPEAVSIGTSIVLTAAFMSGGILSSLVGSTLDGLSLSEFSTYQTSMYLMIGALSLSCLASFLFKGKSPRQQEAKINQPPEGT